MMVLVSILIQILYQVLYSLVHSAEHLQMPTLTQILQVQNLGLDLVNEDASVYPFTFGEGGSLTFTGSTDGASADVYFRFEYNPYS